MERISIQKQLLPNHLMFVSFDIAYVDVIPSDRKEAACRSETLEDNYNHPRWLIPTVKAYKQTSK
jgi:hypothetical protein